MAEACQNCGAQLKNGMLSSNACLTAKQLEVINSVFEPKISSACNACGDAQYANATQALAREMKELRNVTLRFLPKIPVVSLQSPQGWKYEPITIVTAQTVTGTGIFSDVASAFTDLFGTQSGTYNAKLREGENLCKTSLRSQTLEMGGNAVLAVDVDYAEVGGQRAMLMVCMTGTAVRIAAFENPDPEYIALAAQMHLNARRMRRIQSVLAVEAIY